ncbi:MAG: cobalamin B12-binding domain-containing protein, partial [Elusimicrobia bacterium]|nr:cobalamin B12-binding domain-containing protein [Elusimicrobiota bacterium]
MNIVCVYIRADKGVLTTETLPLGIAYISSSLVHAGYNTEMLFINARTDIYKILTAVSSFVLPVPQALFAISVMGENEFSFVKKITSAIKKLFPNAQIIAGGTHVQYMPEIFTVENLNIDAL